MAQMDLSPVPDPRLQKPVLPIAQGAPATPDQQPVTPVSIPTATTPAMPEASAAPAEKLNKVPLAFPQLGQQNETQNQQTLRQTQQHGSGISNIHNPILKTLATIGDVVAGTFAPRAEQLIPGTEGNYALHLARAGNAVKGEEEQQMAPVERGLKIAQTHHAEAQAESLPKELASKTLNTAEGIMQWNPETRRYDIPAGTAPEKPESAGKTITTDQGIMQWNPQTNRYDINAGNAPDKAATGTVHQLDDGSLIIAHSDGTATPITMNGEPVKGKNTQPAGDDFAQFYQKWLKEKGAPDNASNEKKARAEWSASGQAPERPPQAMMLVPGENGQSVAQVIRPGSTVAPGSVTPGGASGEAVAANKEAQATAKAKADAARDYRLATTLVANPSPTNDLALVMQYIGSTKPDSLGKLRLNNNEVNLVYGTRSSLGDLEALVSKVQTGQSLTPKQRQDMLNTMKILAESRGDTGGTTGATVRARDPQGRLHEAPAGTPLPAGWKAEQ